MGFVSKSCALLIGVGIAFSKDNKHDFRKKDGYYNCPNWPSLLVLGAQKAGTTSLFAALMNNQNICPAKIDENEMIFKAKEVHFFDNEYWKGPEFYCSRFTTCKRQHKNRSADAEWIDKALHIDCTPGYLDVGIAQRMKKTFSPEARKNIKAIAILREPVERMLSWYNHLRSILQVQGYESCIKKHPCYRILREAFKNINPRLSGLTSSIFHVPQDDHLPKYLKFREFALSDGISMRKGRYIEILEEYFDVFSMENVLILNYDFMMNNQRETLSLVSKFVGIDDSWDPNYSLPHKNSFEFNNKMHVQDIDCQFLRQLSNYYLPYNNKLYNMLFRFRKKFWSHQPYFRRFNAVSHPCTRENNSVNF